jgi:hypothetical protein
MPLGAQAGCGLRASGSVSIHSPLAGEILAAAVFDGDAFDDIFGGLVTTNADGTIVSADGPAAAGIPFEHRNVERLMRSEPLAPAAAACLQLAWRHRDALLSA